MLAQIQLLETNNKNDKKVCHCIINHCQQENKLFKRVLYFYYLFQILYNHKAFAHIFVSLNDRQNCCKESNRIKTSFFFKCWNIFYSLWNYLQITFQNSSNFCTNIALPLQFIIEPTKSFIFCFCSSFSGFDFSKTSNRVAWKFIKMSS